MRRIAPHQIIEAERFFAELEEARYTVSAGIVVYKGKINEKLQERTPEAYEEILRFLREPSCVNVCGYDYELYCFRSTASIYEAERGTYETTIYDRIDYVDDFEEIYIRMRQFFRRMQLGEGESIREAYFGSLRERGLSVYVPIRLLLDMPLGNKDRIGNCMADFHLSEGQEETARCIIETLAGRLDGAAKEHLTARLEGMRG